MKIDIGLKRECVALLNRGMSYRDIYDYFRQYHDGMCYETFRHKIKIWRKQNFADDDTLASGTYPNFIAHNATVQVDSKGEIVQAWIKQSVNDNIFGELLEAIKDNTHPIDIKREKVKPIKRMLEIPLFDMHLPLTDYRETQNELFSIVEQLPRDEINIIIGQDLFHNDDFRGRTSSGKEIEHVNIAEAWQKAREFWYPVIKSCIQYSNTVNIIYSMGNHDESIAWCFVKELEIAFPQCNFNIADDQRKLIYWENCFIGVTHGNEKATINDLRGQFTVEFPVEFANSTVREIHLGHLHHEMACNDVYGVNIRRLSTKANTDKWSKDKGFVGAHKRFMLFEYTPGELKHIHFI